MSKANPTRPGAPDDEAGTTATPSAREVHAGPPRDPHAEQALDGIGVDDQANLLDPELDDALGDVSGDGTSFADDVRSDDSDDEAHERR